MLEENAMNLKIAGLAVVTAAAFAMPSYAHHSFSMFDQEKTVTLKVTVQELEWVNPHVWLRVMIPDASGTPRLWALEMGPPARQLRRGWKADSVKRGDVISVDYHPLKDGSRGGQLVRAILSDGKSVGGAGAADQE
jgi:hypothetical protein